MVEGIRYSTFGLEECFGSRQAEHIRRFGLEPLKLGILGVSYLEFTLV